MWFATARFPPATIIESAMLCRWRNSVAATDTNSTMAPHTIAFFVLVHAMVFEADFTPPFIVCKLKKQPLFQGLKAGACAKLPKHERRAEDCHALPSGSRGLCRRP